MARKEQLEEMLKSDPEDAFLLFAYAKEFEKINNKPQALEIYLKLLQIDPKYVGTYYHLGKLYEDMEDKEKAIQIYDQGILLTKEVKDLHALSELQSAKMNCEID